MAKSREIERVRLESIQRVRRMCSADLAGVYDAMFGFRIRDPETDTARAGAVARDRLARGQCPDCGRTPQSGRRQCSRCAAQVRARVARRHARLDAAGLCRQCGRRPAVEGSQRCEPCRARRRRAA